MTSFLCPLSLLFFSILLFFYSIVLRGVIGSLRWIFHVGHLLLSFSLSPSPLFFLGNPDRPSTRIRLPLVTSVHGHRTLTSWIRDWVRSYSRDYRCRQKFKKIFCSFNNYRLCKRIFTFVTSIFYLFIFLSERKKFSVNFRSSN